MDEGIDKQAGESGAADSGQHDARAEKGEMPVPRRFSMHGRRGSKPDSEQLKVRSKAAFDEKAPIYDEGMQGDHPRALYHCILHKGERAM